MLSALVLAVLVVLGALPARAQVIPQTIRIGDIACRDLLALPTERQDRILIYLNGYLDGAQRAQAWDERVSGERINQALAECRAQPGIPAMRAFERAWSR